MTEDHLNTQAAARARVAEGLCPFCGAGPFIVVAGHVFQKHGIDRLALREILGVYKGTSICEGEYSESLRNRMGRALADDPVRRERFLAGQEASRSQKRKLSEAAKERNRRQAEAVRAVAWPALQEAVQRKHLETMSRYAEWRGMWDSGMSLGQIAQRAGVLEVTVRHGLRMVGCNPSPAETRSRGQKIRTAGLDAVRTATRRRHAQARQEVISRFIALGGDWQALDTLAAERGTSRQSVRELLKRWGVAVPDGRLVSPLRGQRKASRG